MDARCEHKGMLDRMRNPRPTPVIGSLDQLGGEVPTCLGDVVPPLPELRRTRIPPALEGQVDMALEIEGDGMMNYLLDGDTVFVQEAREAEPGELVIGWTPEQGARVRWYDEEDGQVWLVPENPKHERVPFTEGCLILGKIVGMEREA